LAPGQNKAALKSYPTLPYADAKKYYQKFLEDREVYESAPEKFFEADKSVPCELDAVTKKHFVYESANSHGSYKLLSGDCSGGVLNGDIRMYTKTKIGTDPNNPSSILETISLGSFQNGLLQGELTNYTRTLNPITASGTKPQTTEISFEYGGRKAFQANQLRVLFSYDYTTETSGTIVVYYITPTRYQSSTYEGSTQRSLYRYQDGKLHGVAHMFGRMMSNGKFMKGSKICYVYGNQTKPENCQNGVPTADALVKFDKLKPGGASSSAGTTSASTTASPATTSAPVYQGPKVVIAVFDIELKRIRMKRDFVDTLSDYLTTRLVEAGRFEVIPRSELRKRLLQQKKKSYKTCYDQSCQIELGREMAAEKTLSTQIQKLGSKCKVTAAVYDLKKAASGLAATATAKCNEDGLVKALDTVVTKISR
jgi:hypothetical protein